MNRLSGPLTLGHVNIEATRCSTSQSRRLKEEYPDIVLGTKTSRACRHLVRFSSRSPKLRQLKLTNNILFQATKESYNISREQWSTCNRDDGLSAMLQ